MGGIASEASSANSNLDGTLAMALSTGPIPAQTPATAPTVFGYTDFSAESKIEQKFLAVPDAKLAGQQRDTRQRSERERRARALPA